MSEDMRVRKDAPARGARRRGRGRRRTRRGVRVTLLVAGVLVVALAAGSVGALAYFRSDRPQAYEERVRAFERDLMPPASRGIVLLAGSSYFDNWETSDTDLSPLETVNVGIGGTKIGEQIAFIDRLVVPFAPRALVLYAGSNDINGLPLMSGDPESVVDRVKEYVRIAHDRLPEMTVYYVAITEAPVREKVRDDIRLANSLLEEWAQKSGEIIFIDTAPALLTPEGEIDESIFLDDRLHLNPEGYEKFSAVIRERLLADLG